MWSLVASSDSSNCIHSTLRENNFKFQQEKHTSRFKERKRTGVGGVNTGVPPQRSRGSPSLVTFKNRMLPSHTCRLNQKLNPDGQVLFAIVSVCSLPCLW